jgi:hypothetical protein
MLTSAATITGTEASRPGLRVRVRRMSRSARLAVLLGLAAGATLVTTALPASATTVTHSFNFARTQLVAGTNCYIEVGTDMNSNDFPGTATEVACNSPHMISVVTQLQDAPLAGGPWGVWGQTPTYNYTSSYGTPFLWWDWASCGGPEMQWRVMASIAVDGVWRGWYADNGVHDWTPCH